MACRHYNEEKMSRICTITRCTTDGHIALCSGYREYCDKPRRACKYALTQNDNHANTFCKHSKDLEECGGDSDWCQLSNAEQAKMEWK